MIEWIHHRPPLACNGTEIRVAERLKGLADSPYTWTVIWGYYYQDSAGTLREGDFLILGPAGGMLVLEVKHSLPRHFLETGRWEGAGGDLESRIATKLLNFGNRSRSFRSPQPSTKPANSLQNTLYPAVENLSTTPIHGRHPDLDPPHVRPRCPCLDSWRGMADPQD
jgi:hypothetical protein